MKTKFLVCLLALASTTWLISCTQEPEETDPNMKWQAEMSMNPVEGIISGTVICPNPGNNCKVQSGLGCPSSTSQREMRDSFYNAYYNNPYENDLVPFLNRHEWKEIFPEVNLESPIITRVKSGDYGIFLAEDTSLVITSTPTGQVFKDEEVVVAYKRMPGDCR